MLSVFFPVWLAARASKSEVFRTNYRPHAGVITSSSAHLIICLPPVGPPLTIGCTEAKENCISHEIHNSSHHCYCTGCILNVQIWEKRIQTTGRRPPLTGFDHPLETRKLLHLSSCHEYSFSWGSFRGGNQTCRLLLLLPYFSFRTLLTSCKSGLQILSGSWIKLCYEERWTFIIQKHAQTSAVLSSDASRTMCSYCYAVCLLHGNLLLKFVASTSISAFVLSSLV